MVPQSTSTDQGFELKEKRYRVQRSGIRHPSGRNRISAYTLTMKGAPAERIGSKPWGTFIASTSSQPTSRQSS